MLLAQPQQVESGALVIIVLMIVKNLTLRAHRITIIAEAAWSGESTSQETKG
jgi:hypothetical protein